MISAIWRKLGNRESITYIICGVLCSLPLSAISFLCFKVLR